MSVRERADLDAVIIGGGVIGLALAYELCLLKRRVLVLERGRVGAGASWAAGGMLAPVSEAEIDAPEVIELGCDSLRRYPDFVAGIESLADARCGLRTEGTLWVAVDRDDLAELRHLSGTLSQKGLTSRPLDAEELREREPHLSGRVLGGLELADDHQVDPRALCRSLDLAVARSGGEVATGAVAERIEARGGLVRAVAGRDRDGQPFRVGTGTVVVAAGAWSGRDLELPIGRLGLRPVKGQLVRLRGPRLLRHVVRTPEVYLVPRSDGELLVGATMEEMGFDLSPTGGAVMDLLRRAWEALPGVYDLELAEVSVGLRSAVDDHLPVIGATEVGGLFLAVGHFRNGVLLAPATAHYLARWIVGGSRPPELDPFAPARLMRDNAVRRT
jgi:glycine oxidase